MSIENRGENKWRFRVRKDGVNYSQTFYGTGTEAEREHKKFEVDVMRGKIGYDENMKFSELCQLVFDEHAKKNTSLNTQNTYRNFYNNHALEFFGDIKLNKIKKIDVQKFINSLTENFEYNSVKQFYSILKLTFNKAVDWEIMTKSPCSNIILQKKEHNKKYNELLSDKELQDLLNAITNEKNKMLKTIYAVAIGMGMRQGEILGLSLRDVDFAQNTIDINKQYLRYTASEGKSAKKIDVLKTKNSYRQIYMTIFVSNTLREYIDNMKIIDMKNQYLFIDPKTKDIISHNSVYYKFSKLLKKYDLKNISFHDLRHLHATMLVNNGVNVVSIAKRLGDTVDTISNTYLHSIDKIDKEAVEKLDLYIEKSNTN